MALVNVDVAKPYFYGSLGSLSRETMILLRQSRFPCEYDTTQNTMYTEYSDRLAYGDRARWARACKLIPGKDKSLQHFFMKGKVKDILAFLIVAMNADTGKAADWDGFRVLGGVNFSNGYPVYTLQLFARGKGSTVKLYSGAKAPNVEGFVPKELKEDPFVSCKHFKVF